MSHSGCQICGFEVRRSSRYAHLYASNFKRKFFVAELQCRPVTIVRSRDKLALGKTSGVELNISRQLVANVRKKHATCTGTCNFTRIVGAHSLTLDVLKRTPIIFHVAQEASKSASSEKENAAPSTIGATHSPCTHGSGGKVVFISGSLQVSFGFSTFKTHPLQQSINLT